METGPPANPAGAAHRRADSTRAPTAADPSVESLINVLVEPALLVADNHIRFANESARRLFGADIIGAKVDDAIPHPVAVERLHRPSSAAADEVELVGLGDSPRHWLMRAAPLGAGALLVRFLDRSEARAAEQMRVDFVANASHELRTPLATLLGYAETLRENVEDLDDQTREQFTAIVHDEARRMQRLVEDLISLSRIEAERFSRPKDAIDLVALVGEARAGFIGSHPHAEIGIEATPNTPPIVGERSELLQLLDNLVSNSLRYGRPGRPVRIRVTPDQDMVRLVVEDEGEGIPPEHIKRVTERFYRVDPGRSRAVGGTGLGLSIVKHIVERHRGRLDIESEVGRGTAVHVLLPVARRALS